MTREQKLSIVWKRTHNDFKGNMYGERYTLVYREGTCSVPLSSLTDAEINDRLPREMREAS